MNKKPIVAYRQEISLHGVMTNIEITMSLKMIFENKNLCYLIIKF